MEHSDEPSAGGAAARANLTAEALVTLIGALFAFLALDDITTDNATTGFLPEYRVLAGCGAWLLFFLVQLWRNNRRVLAGVSVLMLVAAAWVASDGIGHKNAGGWNVFWPQYTVILIAWLWFVVAAVRLLAQTIRSQSAAAFCVTAPRVGSELRPVRTASENGRYVRPSPPRRREDR